MSEGPLALAPGNGIDGTYVGFQITGNLEAEHWFDANLYAELGDIVTTPTADLVSLAHSDDGVYRLPERTGGEAWFLLQSAATLPAAFDTTATLTLHDGPPDAARRSVSFPVSWSNSASPHESANTSVLEYTVPELNIHHGATGEVTIRASVTGAATGDRVALSAATSKAWPGNEYELVGTEFILLNAAGDSQVAALCRDPSCIEAPGSYHFGGQVFYLSAAGDYQVQGRYLFRWLGTGTPPAPAMAIWGENGAHSPSSDNAGAPTLTGTTAHAQSAFTVTPTTLSAADAPLRVQYALTINHAASDGFYPDLIFVDLPTDAIVVPRTSRWSMGPDLDDPNNSLTIDQRATEPFVDETLHTWTIPTFISSGADGRMRFDALLPATQGTHAASAWALVGEDLIDLTATLGDDSRATASVDVSP
jgi:hypothetical protein